MFIIKKFTKSIKISLVTILSLSFSLSCFSDNPSKKEEKLICNEFCRSVNRIEISHLNGTQMDLSGSKDIIKNIIDKNMKSSGNLGYGVIGDGAPGGTLSSYSKVEKDNKRLLTRSRRGNSSELIQVAVIFRANDCDKSAVDIDVRLLASNYMVSNLFKCNGKDAAFCVNAKLSDFAENELSEYLFKELKAYDL
ncbi:MAG: hypothetical protein EOO52_10155 [Gammaproteobacteria bacterium]|nr:MAG: hypothetical protein EOO52_10155 [Gammaproteobacteria bacterium]